MNVNSKYISRITLHNYCEWRNEEIRPLFCLYKCWKKNYRKLRKIEGIKDRDDCKKRHLSLRNDL